MNEVVTRFLQDKTVLERGLFNMENTLPEELTQLRMGILRFYQAQGRAPPHGEDHDIFERRGLLNETAALPASMASGLDALDEDALLAELGIGDDAGRPGERA